MTAPRRTGKTGSKNPAAKPTSVAAWKKSAVAPPVLMPSGNYMRIKKIGLQALIKMGTMPNSLMAVAQKAVAKGQKEEVSDADMVDMLNDPKKVEEIGRFMDQVTILCAQEPEIHPLPPEGVERNDEFLYIDEVDEEDKMFLFQVVTGGTTDVETFRKQHESTVASLRGREDVELPTE